MEPGTFDTVLAYCHNSLNNTLLTKHVRLPLLDCCEHTGRVFVGCIAGLVDVDASCCAAQS